MGPSRESDFTAAAPALRVISTNNSYTKDTNSPEGVQI